jgi:hypothetical protein
MSIVRIEFSDESSLVVGFSVSDIQFLHYSL